MCHLELNSIRMVSTRSTLSFPIALCNMGFGFVTITLHVVATNILGASLTLHHHYVIHLQYAFLQSYIGVRHSPIILLTINNTHVYVCVAVFDGTGRCSVAQCYDKTWAMLVQS